MLLTLGNGFKLRGSAAKISSDFLAALFGALIGEVEDLIYLSVFGLSYKGNKSLDAPIQAWQVFFTDLSFEKMQFLLKRYKKNKNIC